MTPAHVPPRRIAAMDAPAYTSGDSDFPLTEAQIARLVKSALDEDQAAKTTRDPVARATRSAAADQKAATHRTPDGALVHSFVIEGVDDFRLIDDDRGTVELAAGEYVFFCDIPGHREGGMEGTLSVT